MKTKLKIYLRKKSLKKLPILKNATACIVFLNVLNLILLNGWHYCYCEKYEGPRYIVGSKDWCAMCIIPIDFSNFEEYLDKNDFNENLLRSCHTRLVHYLLEVFRLNKLLLEYFLFEEFCYSGCDWNTG